MKKKKTTHPAPAASTALPYAKVIGRPPRHWKLPSTIAWHENGYNSLNKVIVIQATPAMSTSRISILSLMSKWFFIPNIFSLYIFAFQLRLFRKRLTWSNGYLEVIFHALDVFSIIFATSYVEVKNRRSHGCCIVCFGYVHVLPEVRKSSKQKSETIKVI